jgi:hypothetical protein
MDYQQAICLQVAFEGSHKIQLIKYKCQYTGVGMALNLQKES